MDFLYQLLGWLLSMQTVPCLIYSDAQLLREKCVTPILKQVRDYVIRYRYGDEQHLDEALKRIFQYGLGGGVARRNVTEDGKYCLVLVFEAKALELADFEKRQEAIDKLLFPLVASNLPRMTAGSAFTAWIGKLLASAGFVLFYWCSCKDTGYVKRNRHESQNMKDAKVVGDTLYFGMFSYNHQGR
ncbi:hypothetical protein L2E82_05578 [Cichorium intybus]|uniref:Uncharacterized protein n=1 Tax=Cichorium intybus TaxID=13427 RepID=A0ACB9H8S6_CICIN|nr:hypothetical protein L2E82_05578 [Cichorium intybus]